MHSDLYNNRSEEYACKIYKWYTGKSLKKEEKRVKKLEEDNEFQRNSNQALMIKSKDDKEEIKRLTKLQ